MGTKEFEQPFEKPVLIPTPDNKDAASHAWADARLATDIMAEHGLFFALLVSPDVAEIERKEAFRFSETFAELHKKIASAARPPDRGDRGRFTQRDIEQIKPLISQRRRRGMSPSVVTGSPSSLVVDRTPI